MYARRTLQRLKVQPVMADDRVAVQTLELRDQLHVLPRLQPLQLGLFVVDLGALRQVVSALGEK
jgi:hypothetical protein